LSIGYFLTKCEVNMYKQSGIFNGFKIKAGRSKA
jgi:hypothetical protein